MTTLTITGREEALDKAMRKWFEPRVAKIMSAKDAVGQAVYELHLKEQTDKARAAVDAGLIPKTWVDWETDCDFQFARKDGEPYTTFLYHLRNEIANGRPIRAIYEGRGFSIHIPNELRNEVRTPEWADSPKYPTDKHVIVNHPDLVAALNAIVDDIANLYQEAKAVVDVLESTLSACRTLKQLQELSPELASYYPAPQVKSSFPISVETLNKANAILNSIKEGAV
jgi:hypothetical protein